MSGLFLVGMRSQVVSGKNPLISAACQKLTFKLLNYEKNFLGAKPPKEFKIRVD